MIQKVLARTRRHAVIIAALLLFWGLPLAALGQSGDGRKVIRLEAIKVEGRIRKPQAFYILQRSHLNFRGSELKRSFVSKIIQSIGKKPF